MVATAMQPVEHFRVMPGHFQPSPLVATSSAVAAAGGGVVAAIDSAALPAWIGLATVGSALITAALGGLGTWFKAWLDYRSREEQARWDRHEIANKLNVANLRLAAQDDEIKHMTGDIVRLTNEVAENRQTIEKLRNGHGGPT